VEMSESAIKTEKKYPANPEDIETEKEITEAIKKLNPTSLRLKAFGINSNLLKLKELENLEQDEITHKDLEGAKAFHPNLAHINDLINGTRAPTEDELKNLNQYFTDEELVKKDELLSQIKPISDFWLTAIKHHALFKEVLNENDEKALKHLTRVEYKQSEDAQHPLDFTLNFHFAANDYFENELLTITLHAEEQRVAKKIDGTDIKWKEGKNLTRKTVQKKQKNKKTGQTRTVSKEEDCDSFFKLFKTVEAHEHDHDHDHGDDDEHDHEHGDEIDEHSEWAYSILEEVIPYSLEYFLGVRKDFGGEEGGDDDFVDDDDEDDDDDEEKPKPSKGKGKRKESGGAGPVTGDDQKKECKQQ